MVFQLVSMPPSQRWLTIMLAGAARGFGDRILRLALGADEQHLAAGGDGLADEVERAREQRHGLRQVDDVDAVAIAENIRLHLRIPAVGLVAEMRAGLEQLLHGDVGRRHSLSPPVKPLRCRETGAQEEPTSHRYDGPACGMARI